MRSLVSAVLVGLLSMGIFTFGDSIVKADELGHFKHVEIFDLSGKKVADYEFFGSPKYLTFQALSSGGQPLANGVYVCVVTTRDPETGSFRREVRKMVVLQGRATLPVSLPEALQERKLEKEISLDLEDTDAVYDPFTILAPQYAVSSRLVSQDPISRKVFATFDYTLSAQSNKEIVLSGILRTYRGYTEVSIRVEEKRRWWWWDLWQRAEKDWRPASAATWTWRANQVIPFTVTLKDLNSRIKEYRIVVEVWYFSLISKVEYKDTHYYYWRL